MQENLRIDRLQGLWLQQLYNEHEDICCSHGVDLPTPIFEITESKKVYGSWQASTGILSLSRYLILQHPWSVTLQVLKHEMAHQLCNASLQAEGAKHGVLFQEACARLGVLPEFRKPGLVAPDLLEAVAAHSELSESGRKCLEKIEKLLALGRSANEHEAALAMEKANELLEKYHLQGLGEADEQRYAWLVIDQKKKKIAGYQKHICSILQEFFYVRVVLSQLYDPASDESFKTIELFGTKENVAIGEYCFHFLENRLALLWRANKSRFKGAVRTEKNSYYLGLLRGFHQKLGDQKKYRMQTPAVPQAGALVLAEEQRLAGFVGMRFPRIRKVSARGARVYGETYREGMVEGRHITLNEGVGGQAPVFGGLLS